MDRFECQRARELAALQPDGALTEVETVALRHHLDECAACRGFADIVATLSERLAVAPLEPAPGVWTVAPTRRGMAARARWTLASVAAVLVLVALTGGSTTTPDPSPTNPYLLIPGLREGRPITPFT
ncbi:MAG: hypothetical protein FJW96_06055 [Actinobacteria bacterium]|nr:hypothetical protein [Actinomycetota bacterium]